MNFLNQEQSKTPEEIMNAFFNKFSESTENDKKTITLEDLQELKEHGISTEKFLDYLCENRGLLLHGSINDIEGDKLISNQKQIFASDMSAIAIMKSLYSNRNVNLDYPYSPNKENPLVLKIHTPSNGKFVSKNNGFVYIVNHEGFKNEPQGSWQYKQETNEVKFNMVVETEKDDFNYPVEIHKDNKE